jgi:hypothetical protein
VGAIITASVFGPLPPTALTIVYFDAVRFREADRV